MGVYDMCVCLLSFYVLYFLPFQKNTCVYLYKKIEYAEIR